MEEAVTTAATARASAARFGLPFPGRRRERAAGERIAALFEEHGRMVYGVSRLLLRDPVEAEDAAQQTFLSAYRALLAGQQPRDPSAWLGTIARNECRSRLRARQLEPLTLVREPVGDELQRDVGQREEIQALCAALAELPPQQRDVVVLREFYGLSYAEVAAALGVSGSAVESLLFRSRKRLQEQLRPVRSALGMLTLPITLRDSLAQALPGFGSGGASAGAGVAALAKLASAPVVAKVAAATLAVGTVGTVAGLEHGRSTRHHVHSAPRSSIGAPRNAAAPVAVAATTSKSVVSFASRQVATSAPTRVRSKPAATTSGAGEQHDSAGSGGNEAGQDHGSASSHETEHQRDYGTAGGSHEGSGSGDSGGSGQSESGDSGHSGDSGDRSEPPPPAEPPPPPEPDGSGSGPPPPGD